MSLETSTALAAIHRIAVTITSVVYFVFITQQLSTDAGPTPSSFGLPPGRVVKLEMQIGL